jgi:3-phenylpropionate/cinnamic acid dioxygenase small subunit
VAVESAVAPGQAAGHAGTAQSGGSRPAVGGQSPYGKLRELVRGELPRIDHADPRTGRIIDFYWREAELLDDNLLDQWLDTCLHDDLRYTMPVRVGRSRERALAEGEFVGDMAHFDDDLATLRGRRDKLATGLAWAEDPPSRTRRHVTNIRGFEVPAGFPAARTGRLYAVVRSYLLVLRNRLDRPNFELISGERVDLVAEQDGRLVVLQREILVDQSTLGTVNLAIFL